MNSFRLPIAFEEKRLGFEQVNIKSEKEKFELTKQVIFFIFNFVPASVVKCMFRVFFKFLVHENITNSEKLDQLQWRAKAAMIAELNRLIEALNE